MLNDEMITLVKLVAEQKDVQREITRCVFLGCQDYECFEDFYTKVSEYSFLLTFGNSYTHECFSLNPNCLAAQKEARALLLEEVSRIILSKLENDCKSPYR